MHRLTICRSGMGIPRTATKYGLVVASLMVLGAATQTPAQDTTAPSRDSGVGKVDGIVAVGTEGLSSQEKAACLPPAGRLAIVADGNSPDPDDIGATAVIFGLLDKSGLSERLVHVSHSCDLQPTDRISVADERRRQQVLEKVCREAVGHFGPFKNLSGSFNCRTDLQAAVGDLRVAINHSTDSDPLWIIEAGEPDLIGYALQSAEPMKRQHVHVVSHHPANDNAGDFFSWQQILAYGVMEHQIGDQNVGLKTTPDAWEWAKQHRDPRMRWIWKQLAYAEQDGVVKFQTGYFDCSDAGMVFWWLTGADRGGDKSGTPAKLKQMLLTSKKDAAR